jgi:hypothetical protein
MRSKYSWRVENQAKIKAIAYYLRAIDDQEMIDDLYAQLAACYADFNRNVEKFFAEDFDKIMDQDLLFDLSIEGDSSHVDELQRILRDSITKKNSDPPKST